MFRGGKRITIAPASPLASALVDKIIEVIANPHQTAYKVEATRLSHMFLIIG